MAQINFTLDHDFFIGLFKENRDEAFGKLMEAMLNQVLKAESNEQLGAENYERSDDRQDYRNGSRERGLTTRIGKLILEVPRHRNKPFRSLIFENYQRNEQALIATMMEMYPKSRVISTQNVIRDPRPVCRGKDRRAVLSP
jgi:transposase-like protein